MSSEEYDLRKSEKDVKQLYPVLLDKKGRVIDGLHRLNVDSNWRTETLEYIDDEEKFLKARIISNLHRRVVPATEIRAWINDLAEIALKKGIEVGKIGSWIAEETGYSDITVRHYLDDKFKLKDKSEYGREGRRKQLEAISEMAIPMVEAEEKLGHETFQRLKADLREEVKEELRRDPQFIVETIEKAPEILPTLPKQAVDEEGMYVPVVTQKQAEEMKEVLVKTQRELEERRADVDVQERGRIVKNWMAHGNVVAVADALRCPICGSNAHNIVWKCHPDLNIYESQKRVKEKLEGG